MYELNLKIRSSPITDTMSSSIELSGTYLNFRSPFYTAFGARQKPRFMSPSSRHSFSLIQFTNCSYRERYSVDGLHYFTSTCFFESLITSWNFKYMIPQRSSLQGQEFQFLYL